MSEVDNTTAAAKPADQTAPVAKIDAAAHKAQAEASAKVAPAAKAAAAPAVMAPAASGQIPVARKAAPVKQAAAKTVKTKTAIKTAPKSTGVNKPALARKAAKPLARIAAKPGTKLKETIMATAENTDITATAKDMLADVQARAKASAGTAYAKTAELASEATEFTKANVEAVVESSKIFAAGAQELIKDNIETGKTVIATVTEDAKKVAAVKSPTELMQLQGEIARRNFDALVSYGSKRTEAWVKLYNDAFAPISNRVSVAVEKVKQAA